MREVGVIKFFDDKRGFGFLAADAGGADVFFHRNAILNAGSEPIELGTRFEFEFARHSDGRLRAEKLKLVESGGRE